MLVRYTAPNGRLTFEVEVTTAKQAFAVVAAVQELFEEKECGCCQSEHIHCEVRTHDTNEYYKLVCTACGATLDFGQKKDGKGLFVKRKDKDLAALPNRGWYIWQPSGR